MPATNPIRESHGWEKEIVARERSEKGGTWPGMQWDYQTNQKRRKKKNKRRELVNSRKGTLPGEIKVGKTKMSLHWPQARWVFTEEGQDNLPNM